MTKPLKPANADGTYCFAIGTFHRRISTCTETPIPPEQVEAVAKRFQPDPEALTVYLIRKRWADTANHVRIAVDGNLAAMTVPECFVRLRLRPGRHELAAFWDEGSAAMHVDGVAGELQFLELVGSVWTWGSRYHLERGDPADGRSRARRLRLVADFG